MSTQIDSIFAFKAASSLLSTGNDNRIPIGFTKAELLVNVIQRLASTMWMQDQSKALTEARPHLPCELNDREQDSWEPLLAIADVAGGPWPQQARQAAIALSGQIESETNSIALLRDIRSIFTSLNTDRLASEHLLSELTTLKERQWATLCGGRPITAFRLSKLLAPFGISPDSIRIGTKTPKGYHRDQFTQAFARYLGKEGKAPSGS